MSRGFDHAYWDHTPMRRPRPSIGQMARRALGRHFQPIGNAYRRVFVNLDLIAETFDGLIPNGAKVLDIGGGDGALVERLLNRRPDLTITMCDLAPSMGSFLTRKVELLPATDFKDVAGPFDCVTISDVVHHVPVSERAAFFQSLAESCRRWGCSRIILKDIEPGGFRASLSVLSDKYITGDRHVALFSRADFAEMAARHFPEWERVSAMPDKPNYCEMLSAQGNKSYRR